MGKLEVHRNTLGISPGNALYSYFESLVRTVDQGAAELYNIDRFDGLRNNKYKRWCEIAKDYMKQTTNTPYNTMCTRYGSAVEEYFNRCVKANKLPPPAGYLINIQVDKNVTIPDIVISDQYNNEIAWLDITSENSAEHIFRKAGSGWRQTPFVGELLYDPLDLSMITIRGESIASRARAHYIARLSESKENKLTRFMVECTDKALREIRDENRKKFYTREQVKKYNASRPYTKWLGFQDTNWVGRDRPYIADKFGKAFGLYIFEPERQIIVGSILLMYISSSTGSYRMTARQIYSKLYVRKVRQSKDAALPYLTLCLREFEKSQEIYWSGQ